MKEAEGNGKGNVRRAIAGGTLVFPIPYDGQATFDWWLDVFGHDVIVECMKPWEGLRVDIHGIGMAPRFTEARAREIAEALCRRIMNNLEFVIAHREAADLEFESYYDNKQMPLYRTYAEQEVRRREGMGKGEERE